MKEFGKFSEVKLLLNQMSDCDLDSEWRIERTRGRKGGEVSMHLCELLCSIL